MLKAYDPVNWQNYPSENTPINETNLLKMGNAIDTIDDRVIVLDSTKLDKSTANAMVRDIVMNTATGVITITYLSGATATIDTKLEKLAVNFSYDAQNQRLVITLDNGTVQYVDMSALLTQYEFVDSATMAFTVDANGNVTASVKNGSITADKLQPNYLADVTAQAGIATQKAQDSASSAALSATEASRASREADRAAQYSDIVAPNFYVDTDTMTLYMKTGVGVDFIVADGMLCWKII